MKTSVISFAIILAFSLASYGQVAKNSFFISGSGNANIEIFEQFANNPSNLRLGVMGGYMLNDWLAATAYVQGQYNFDPGSQFSTDIGQLDFGPGLRFLFQGEAEPAFVPFIDLQTGISFLSQRGFLANGGVLEEIAREDWFWTSALFLGANYFLNPRIAIEANLGSRLFLPITENINGYTLNNQLNLGILVWFPEK